MFFMMVCREAYMFKCFYPTVYYDSVYSIDFWKLYFKGYRALLMDIDNTLVEHDAPANEEAIAFFSMLHNIGYKTCIVSNNTEERVKTFAVAVDSEYVFLAEKPRIDGYLKAMELMECSKENSLFLGDQLFTDILGANKAGIRSVLVKPIKLDPVFRIILKRGLEAIVKPFYFRYARKYPKDL